MPRRRLEHVEDAVEIGREHFSPFLLGAVDEGAPPAAADPRVGKAAIDAAESIECGLHRIPDGGGICDVADAGIDLAGTGGHGRRGASVLLGVAAPDRDVAAGGVERLRDAKPDAAIAAGDNGDAAGKVEDVHCELPWGVSIWCGAR